MEFLAKLKSLISQTLVIQRELESNTLDFVKDFKESIKKGREILDLLEEVVIKGVERRNDRLSTLLVDSVLALLQSLVDDFPLLQRREECGEEKDKDKEKEKNFLVDQKIKV